MRSRKKFNTLAVAAIALTAIAAAIAVVPLLSAYDHLWTAEDSEHKAGSRTFSIPGLFYPLAEVHCRTWHRNRSARPYNFALTP